MSRITMLDLDALRETRLAPLIERALDHRAPDPGFFAVMGHNLDIAEAVNIFWMNIFNSGGIRQEVKEVMRVQLSRMAECNY